MAITGNRGYTGGTPDYFLKIDGIKGESQDDKHREEIQLESWSIGLTQNGSFSRGVGGGGAGKAAFEEFRFMMRSNVATPRMFLASATGEHIPKAVLSCRKAGGKQEDYFVFTLYDVIVSSFKIQGPDGTSETREIQPFDEFTLNFSKIELSYKMQDVKGGMGAAVKAGYDLAKNAKV